MYEDEVYETLKTVPKGYVTTYGEIGKNFGINPRLVGNVLHRNPDPKNIPCHRVVNAKGYLSGSFAFGGKDSQKELLLSEGVKVVNNRVDLGKYMYFL